LCLLHAAELGGPGNLTCLRKHSIYCRSTLEPRVIDQEIDVGKISCRLDHILGVVVVRYRPKGKSFVDTDTLNIELPGLLQHRIGDPLIVHPPATIKSLWTRPGVTLPCIALERLGLHPNKVQFSRPQLESG